MVVYLVRLQIRQILKNRLMTEKGLEFGMIQNVTGQKRPLAKISAQLLTQTQTVTAAVPALDISSKRWTASTPVVIPTYRWN